MNKNAIKKLLQTGFFHIFGASTLNKILSALLSIVLVRLLSKGEYGVYAYALNFVAFFTMFNGLGVVSALLQIGSEKNDDEQQAIYFNYGFKAGILIDTIYAAIIIAIGAFAPLPLKNSGYYIALMSLRPFLYFLCDVELIRMRVNLQNREYAAITNLQTLCIVIFSVVGAIFFKIEGIIVGQYLALLFTYVVAKVGIKVEKAPKGVRLLHSKKVSFWKIAITSAINNGLGQALTLLGTVLVGFLLADEELVATYKVATTIPFALAFVPAAITTYIYPYFAKHKDDLKWTMRNYKKLTKVVVISMVLITVGLSLFAKPIIVFIFGESYTDSVPIFLILMIGFFFNGSFRIITSNLLVTQRRLTFNTFNGVVQLISYLVLNVVLIPLHGLVGAALAYTLTMVIGSMLYVPYYLWVAGKPERGPFPPSR